MDPFTQKILEKAEQRSRTLGISKCAKTPLSDHDKTSNRISGCDQVELRKTKENDIVCEERRTSKDSPKKITRSFTADKENLDVGIEISITTGTNVEVQVEVDEREIDADGNEVKRCIEQLEPSAQIRDSSRSRLQRLGLLYSDADSLSSPIHRTEDKFHEEISKNHEADEDQSRRPRQKLGKLMALADSIKNWEDDTSHPDYKHAKVVNNEAHRSPMKKKEERPLNDKKTVEKKKTYEYLKQSTIKKDEPDSQIKTTANIISKQTKQLSWDKTVMDSLEAQGFQKRQSSSTKISYDYVEQRKSDPAPQSHEPPVAKTTVPSAVTPTKSNMKKSPERTIPSFKSGFVSGRTAVFEKAAGSPSKQPQKDPAEMSLKERMMFFEKNKGAALVPKAAFGMAAPVCKGKEISKTTETKTQSSGSEKRQVEMPKDFPTREVKIQEKLAALQSCSSTISENKIKADLNKQKQNDLDILLNRFNRQKQIAQSEVTETPMPPPPPPPPSGQTSCQQRQEHVDAKCMITNKRRSPGQRTDGTEQKISFDDTKRVKINASPKVNRLYPVLSDIETSESENDNYTAATVSAYSSDERRLNNENDLDLDESLMESEDGNDHDQICNMSLRREIMQAVQSNENQFDKNREKDKRRVELNGENYYGDSSLNSCETSDYSGGVDDYLNEALDDEEDECESDSNNGHPGSTNGTTSSNSFCYRRKPRNFEKCLPISDTEDENPEIYRNAKTPVKSSMKLDPADDGSVTLVHTVSFYRRQQSSNSNNSTPVRKIQRNELSGNYTNTQNGFRENQHNSDNDSDAENDVYLVQEKIKKLLDEVCKQQQVIAQTSQALNLCASTIEFSGSTEAVEGERHLLVATHRRQAALDEVQRLRVEGSLRPSGAPKEKGRLTVKEITVPLKQDYIRKLSNDTISGHHLVCLLKYNEHVLATKSVPSLPGLIAVRFPDVLTLDSVYADFKMTLEIYGMTAQREVLPHEVKYHINLNKKSGGRTPKSKKANDSRLVMPIVQSPAGPNVVRTPTLVQYGFVIFSLREIQRNTWSLNQVSNVNPLEGIVQMKVNCELSVSLEYKGFLTMFEDISGFGAWHRRWCQLNGHVLNYWKYPDDEKKKAPIGTIDLYSCCSKKITTAPRDVCARLNTFLLECQRPAKESDEESLLTQPKGKITVVKILLSADTKEEREEWCAYLNKALMLLRAWNNTH